MSQVKPTHIRRANTRSPPGEMRVKFTDEEDVPVSLERLRKAAEIARRVRLEQRNARDRHRNRQPYHHGQYQRRSRGEEYLTPDEEIDRLLSSDSDSEAPSFVRPSPRRGDGTRLRPRVIQQRRAGNIRNRRVRAEVRQESEVEAAPAQWDKVRCPRFHSLVYLPSRNSDGWACDFGVGALGHGKIDLYVKARFGLEPTEPWRCASGCTGHYQMQGVPMYTCRICNFDMCHKCYERAADALNKLKLVAAKVEEKKVVDVQHTRLFIVGEANAGKTSLVRSLFAQPFIGKRAPTTCLTVSHASASSATEPWTNHGSLRDDYTLTTVISEVNSATPKPADVVTALARKRRDYAVEAAEVERILRTKKLDLTIGLDVDSRSKLSDSESGKNGRNRKKEQKKGQEKAGKKESSFGMSVWDFGGVEVFQHLHTRLLAGEGVYVVVFNMANYLKKKKSTTARIEACVMDIVNRGATWVAIVGTHLDLVERKQKATKEVDAQLAKVFAGSSVKILRNPRRKTNLWFFPVDNTTHSGTADLREAIFRTRRESTHKLNLRWLRLLDSLSRDSLAFLTLPDLKHRAASPSSPFSFLRKEKEMDKMLSMLTRAGLVLHLNGSVTQSRFLILDPNWLATNLSKLQSRALADAELSSADEAGMGQDLAAFRKRAIASFDLLHLLWGKQKPLTDFFIDVARQNLLIHDLPSADPERIGLDSYLVTKLLRMRRKGNLRQANPTSLAQIVLVNGAIPLECFHRVVCLAGSYGMEKTREKLTKIRNKKEDRSKLDEATTQEELKAALIGVDFAVVASSNAGGRVWLELNKKRTAVLVASSHDVCAGKDVKVVLNMLKKVNDEFLGGTRRWKTRYLDAERNVFVGYAEAKKKAMEPWFAKGKRGSGRASALASLDLDAFFESVQR